MAPTLEEDVFKLDDNDRTMYVLIQQTHKGVSSVGHKLAEFRKEALDEFSILRTTTSDTKADTTSLKNDMRRLELRLDKLNGRLDRLEGKSDRHEHKLDEHGQKLDEHGKKLDLLLGHFGISEE